MEPPLTPDIVPVQLSPAMAGWRLDRALAALLPTRSRAQLGKLVSAGAVSTADGTLLRDPRLKVKGQEALLVAIPAPRPDHHAAEDIPLAIVFEDAHLLVVDKPAGLVVHPAAGHLAHTLVNALLYHCAGRLSGLGGIARPGIVHRIDKDTSGLLVVAKTDPAHEGLARQFRHHTITRRYLAVVAGIPLPPVGRIATNLARSAANRQKVAVVPEGQGRAAITHYQVLEPLRRASLVACRLETGRTHQIRVHMAHIGHPLLGDPAYGRGALADVTRALQFHRQALHAAELGFTHPVSGARLTFESPLPADIQALLSKLRL